VIFRVAIHIVKVFVVSWQHRDRPDESFRAAFEHEDTRLLALRVERVLHRGAQLLPALLP
jgi:hypothetical protein